MKEIRILDLHFSYGEQKVFEGLYMTIPAGETFALVGPSGAGKTTLLKLIAGLLKPISGEIYFGGALVSSPRFMLPPYKRKIGMVFQTLALWPHLSVERHLTLSGGKKQAELLLEQTGLSRYRNRRPWSLSGGERQRLAIARALAPDPEILLLDESFVHLDPPYRKELFSLLSQLIRDKPRTVLVATQEIQSLRLEISGFFLLDGGKVSGPAKLRDLLENSESRYCRVLKEMFREFPNF